MAALREVVAQFDVRVDGAQKLDEIDRKIKHTTESAEKGAFSLKKIGLAIVSAFAVERISEFFKSQIDLGNALQHTSEKTGMSTAQIQKLQYAADQADISSETLVNSLGKLQLQLGGGIAGKGGPAVDALNAVGIKTEDAAGKARDLTDILGDAADAVSKQEDANKRVAMSVQLFGKSGKELLPLLLQGKEGIQKMGKEAEEMGFILGRDFVDQTNKADEAQKKLNWSLRSLKAAIAMEVFPWFKSVVDIGIKFVKGFIDIVKHTTFAKTAFIALGVAIAIANWEIIAIVAAATLVYAAFDDLFNLFSGNKSYIGDTIDQLSGVGTAAEFVKDLTDAWNNLTEAIFGSGDAADQAGESMSFVGVLKATITQVVLVVGAALATIANALAVVIDTAKSAWAAITGDTSGQRSADKSQFKAVQALGKSFDDLGTFGSFSNVKSANEMTPDEWYNLNHFGKAKQRKAISTTRDTVDAKTGRVSHVEIHNHIDARGGDPKKVQAAVHQGTSSALSQNDLRHAHQASRSLAPPVGGEKFANGGESFVP